MINILKKIGKVLLIVFLFLILFLLSVFVYNWIMLAKEAPLLNQPIGTMVEVDGHSMCVYTEGEGDHTIVFLSGSGTAAPILDFKSLYSLLSDEYRIVVIEKFGYGFSDVVDTERSFDTMLRQDREALSKLQIEGPFVLCPHSMSGLEAIMWAQQYPEEVEAIVGLDMALPRFYDDFDFEGTLRYEKLGAFAKEAGIIRFYYGDGSLPPALSKEDKALYRAIACKIALNPVIINETIAVPDACKEIDSMPVLDLPMLMYVSDGKVNGGDNWVEIEKDYAADHSDVELIELDCGHYVHDFEYERIAADMKEFISTKIF